MAPRMIFSLQFEEIDCEKINISNGEVFAKTATYFEDLEQSHSIEGLKICNTVQLVVSSRLTYAYLYYHIIAFCISSAKILIFLINSDS